MPHIAEALRKEGNSLRWRAARLDLQGDKETAKTLSLEAEMAFELSRRVEALPVHGEGA